MPEPVTPTQAAKTTMSTIRLVPDKPKKTAADWVRDMRMSPNVNKTTVGVDTASVTGDLLLATSSKLLGISRRKQEPDPKDSLEFHTVPADFNSLLKEAALLLSTSGGIAPVYAVPAAESGVPCFNGTGLSPENLAEKLRAFLNGGEVAGTAEEPAGQPAGLVLFDLQRPAASGVSADKMLEIWNRYRINFEPYALLPEVRGAAFAPLYRELDQLGYRLLPAESSRRDFVFRAFRYLLRRLRGRKGAE